MREFVEGEGGSAIVVETVHGAGLRRLIREEGATGPAAALLVLKGTLHGLAAVHQTGAAYGDLTPDNVVVTPAGKAKLTAVRAADPTANAPYLAPERWRGVPGGPAADLYAATAVFYECLTGAPPFQAATTPRLGWAHRTLPPVLDRVPADLRRLVERGLAKAPQHRPASAAVFAAELETAAVASFGPDWERSGRAALAALAASYAGLPEPEPVRQAARTGSIRIASMAALAAAALAVAVISAGDRPAPESTRAAPSRPGVTLLPTPQEMIGQPGATVRPLPTYEPVAGAEKTPPPGRKTQGEVSDKSVASEETRKLKPSAQASASTAHTSGPTSGPSSAPATQPPASEPPALVPDTSGPPPSRQPVVDVQVSAGLPVLDVSVGVRSGLLGVSLSLS
ncbi:protein kinase domain-containing protein [Acrocarpospora catenulata]|uniref:protein kinase domain-containing protein n=1 Tax=Acrocarpospora catenulata TaxID=2836182 RepID=UPI001BDA2B97|nr:serine/threonine-protein kinase [Acrocarpospora catenulata]